MAKLLFYIRIFPVTTILVVASFIGTLWILWPIDGALWIAAGMGLNVFIFCGLVGAALVPLFDSFD